ncbi:MAG: eukaryotic-like serine/threonine-protein kinase [Acidobacteriota bacterium]|jgi:serine/threonine-protein kinase|nr:eukaryotic-like serine/threonine-protein kinase [Acidobacteriota bacterium]
MSRAFDTNQTVGEYRILDFLGAGGMGEVYRAMHSKIGRIAAVKVLTQATQSSGFVERFFNEARIQASLQHPNVATLYDFCEVSGQPCIIMEYVDGQTISERITAYGAALPLSETVYVFEKVCEAIEYIHSHGVIHRDIKSNNIKISSQGQIKLLDFGIAKGQTSQQLTQVGSVIGTLQYLAPELIRGGTADASGDVWALGVLLYEMVTGCMPFDADTVGDLCDRIGRVDYAAAAQLNPGVPREVSAIITRCLRKNPLERYRSAGELLADARKLVSAVSKPGVSESVSEVATEYVEAKTNGSSKSLPLIIGAVAAVVVLTFVVIIAFFLFTPSPNSVADGGGAAVTTNATDTARGLTAAPTPAASHDASERVVEVTVSDGKADVYRDAEKIGTTPYSVRGKLGEHVVLTLRREGYADEPVDFVVGEKKAFMYTLAKK